VIRSIPSLRIPVDTRTKRPSPPARGGRRSLRDALYGVAYVAPAWVLLLCVVAIPLLAAVVLSVTNASLISQAPLRFIGLQNFASDVFTSSFLKAVVVTVEITGLALVIEMPVGFGLALLLHMQLRGHQLFRSALLTPLMLTPVAVALMWRFMFNSDLGIIDYLLRQLHLPAPNWLADPVAAVFALVVVDSWQNIAFVMLMLLAGLSSLPREPFEAAALEGASGWRMIRHMTLPMLRNVIAITLILRSLDLLRLFDTVYVMTQGGPGYATTNVGYNAYVTSFVFYATSRGAAVAVAIAVLLLPVYYFWSREGRRR
jgi:multiple sugar transport system permease protein